MTERRFDAIVVGSGAAGSWAAKELTEQGLDVLLLEAGRTIRPEVDYPLPAPAESRFGTRVRALLEGQAIQLRCLPYSGRSHQFFVNDRENPYTTPRGKPFNWFRGRQVGGRLHAWSRVAVRLSDLELKAASRDGYGVDWPLTYEELAPYYDRVESFLGISGTPEGIATLPDGRFSGSIELNPSESAFRAAVEAAFPDRRVIGARLVKHDTGRVPLPLRAALATGRLELRSDAVVQRLTVDPGTGEATGVTFIDRITKRPEEVRASAVVLCASTVETVRVMLNSASPAHPAGLGNSSGRLGRGLMDHFVVRVDGPAQKHALADDDQADPYDFARQIGFYMPRFRNVGEAREGFIRGYTVQGAIGRGTAQWYLLAHGEMLPRQENTVTLDPKRKDAWGIPAARISCTFSANEEAMIADATEAMRDLADAAGLEVGIAGSRTPPERIAWRLWRRRILLRSGAYLPGSAIHEVGGAGLGDDPATSVLDPFGRCWDAPNVFVTDGACFPSGCSQNVTLTIMALAVRACDHLVAERRAGRL